MLDRPLLLKIYEGASMQRWNDQIRIVDFTELDKQAHKMIIAYVLGKIEQGLGNDELDWIEVIEAGIFEYLQRIVLTDLKPPLFHRIKEDREKYIQLNEWVYKSIEPTISCMGPEFCSRFKNYLMSVERNVNRRIISAAHFYATKWEFDIIERADPANYGIGEIRRDILSKQEKYQDLKSMREFLFSQKLKHFVNICGQLRFQIRWSHLHRSPKTSVLGHMFVVAVFSYLFSLHINTDRQKRVNNYLTGLFHDLPEVLTRDIINPVKRSIEGLSDLIKEYEVEEMDRKIYTLLPQDWHKEMRMFTENEFSSTDQRDGKMVKASDDMAAYIEAHLALANGITNESFNRAQAEVRSKYNKGAIDGINFDDIYKQFDK
jgi:5'-deoxynucleotidase YfbR-like HD superfamily hydrolase/competence protein ComGF